MVLYRLSYRTVPDQIRTEIILLTGEVTHTLRT